jgi:hypothetical protein
MRASLISAVMAAGLLAVTPHESVAAPVAAVTVSVLKELPGITVEQVYYHRHHYRHYYQHAYYRHRHFRHY